VAAEAGSPPPAGCGDAVVPRDRQGGRKGFEAKSRRSAGVPNPGTSWEASSEMREARPDRRPAADGARTPAEAARG